MNIKLKPLELKGIIKNNHWGKKEDSIIRKFVELPSKYSNHLAELWFGTHPSGVALVINLEDSVALDALLSKYGEEILGKKAYNKFGSNLSFLFKVLSVAKPLSIQAHPDKELAKILHKSDPENYPDKFPKPEIGIALNKVELLYSLKKESDFKNYLDEKNFSFVPELQEFTSKENSVLEFYLNILRASEEKINLQCQKLFMRLKSKNDLTKEEDYILKIEKDFPEGDIGIFCFYLMNLYTLNPYEALFIDSNVPHAYLSGELLECMAPSDNVVRGGLTPKYKDKETLTNMLQTNFSEACIDKPNLEKKSYQYKLLNSDYFNISINSLDKNESEKIILKDSFQFIFCFEGSGILKAKDDSFNLKEGSTYLVPAIINEVSITANSNIKFIRVSYS